MASILPVDYSNSDDADLTPNGLRKVYITGSPALPVDDNTVGNSDTVAPDQPTIVDKLLGLNNTPRYQLWPERMIREALSAPHDVMTEGMVLPGLRREDFTDKPAPSGFTQTWSPADTGIDQALAVSSLAGTGGLGGVGEEAGAALGSSPFLRPALKYEGKIYKAPVGGQHMDAIPEKLRDTFTQQALSGDDISNFDFGFMNHKGQFLSREDALKYGIDNGLISPHDAKFGALTTTLLSDSSKPGAVIAANKPTFYSAVENAVANSAQTKATPEQWLGYLKNQPGVRAEELQHLGLNDLTGKVITKEELQKHIADNSVKLGEVWKGAPFEAPHVEKMRDEFQKLNDKADALEKKGEELSQPEYDRMNELSDELFKYPNPWLDKSADTKYHSYQLPGGENYREILMTLPEKPKPPEVQALFDKAKEGKASQDEWNKIYQYQDANKQYQSSHWDEPNVLAHIRMNDRNINGKKTLHVEEIQSDWHQAGRKQGYASPENKAKYDKLIEDKQEAANTVNYLETKLKNQVANGARYDVRSLTPEQRAELTNKLNEAKKNSSEYQEAYSKYKTLTDEISNGNPHLGVPDAPFKKNWDELALKKVIRHAAENGYEQVSWTPGETQAARYDLSKSIDKLKYNPDTHHVIAFDKSGNQVLNKMNVEPKDLPNVVGKEVADKLMNADVKDKLIGGTYKVLENADLKVGGEGMKGFYDKMLVDRANALGKKYGAKVSLNSGKVGRSLEEELKNRGLSQKSFNELSLSQRNKILEKVDEGKPVHVLPITPALREQALKKGFPLFSAPYPVGIDKDK